MAGVAGRKNTPEARLRNGAELRNCEQCGAGFWVPRWQREKVKNGGRFCSRVCKHRSMQGHVFYRPPNAGPVVPHSQGYLLEWAPEHPRAHDGRVLQHILVAEQMLGRPLGLDEEVHHINHVRTDNRPENLEVVKSGEHQRMHNAKPGRRLALAEQARRQAQPRDPQTGRFTRYRREGRGCP